MGNKCCREKKKKERHDTVNPSLLVIREAQRKYFNSHIESDADDSDEDDEKEDSTEGMYGSESSLANDPFDDSPDSTDNTITKNGSGGTTTIVQTTITSPVHRNGGIGGNIFNADESNTLTTTTTTVVCKDDANEKDPTEVAVEATVVASKKPPVVKRRSKGAKYIRLSKRGNFFSIFNTEDKKARSVDPKLYEYPFENLVFEGGGNKGLAYCGAVRLLEELNIWPQIKRIAGTSAGAMTAALLAVGYDSRDLEQFFSLNLNKIFLDHKYGYLSLLPNLLTGYGWNPGKRIDKWFGQKIYDKTGNEDFTFKQVYEHFNRELCIVATNLNQMTSLYCHPKTTPDMPVRLAVRMSMSIPGMFKAVKHTLHGQTDVFVDGGVLCNYPIHCFDGWWLSMKSEDNFLEKLQPLEDIPRLLERSERFGTYNEKTLGMQLYSDNEQDLLKYQLENLRHGVQLQELPNTKLAREKIKKKKLQLKTDREHRRLVKAMNSFLRALRKHNADKNENIDREELNAALNDEGLFPRKRRLILFGDVGSDIILDYLDKDHNGQISYNELLSFMEETGISMQNRFLGYQRRNIDSFPSFLDTLQATLLTNVKRVYVEERDLKRTVGINTGHVGTSDFVLEPADIEFVLERGRRSLEAFLKYYVATNHLKKRPEYKRTVEDLNKSLALNDSTQSLEYYNDLPPEPEPKPSSLAAVVGPMIISQIKQEHQDPTSHIPSLDLSTRDHNTVSRTRSGSSSKSVSISEKVEVIGKKKRFGSQGDVVKLEEKEEDEHYDNVKDNDVDSSDDDDDDDDDTDQEQDSENKFLLGGKLVDEADKKSGSSSPKMFMKTMTESFSKDTSKDNKRSCLSPTFRFPSENNMMKSMPHHDSSGRSSGQPSLKVDVQVHQSPEHTSNPATPLIFAMESDNATELHPLRPVHH